MDLSIVNLIKGKLSKEIDRIKRDISKFGPKEALDWPSNLELRTGFDIPEEELIKISARFKDFLKNIKGFKIELDGFEYIIDPEFERNQLKSPYIILIKIKESIGLEYLNEKLNEFKMTKESRENIFKPNVKIAFNDLTESSFNKIKLYLNDKNFKKILFIDNITLLLNKNDRHIIYKKMTI